MASTVRFKLNEDEARLVDQLCTEFDFEQFIPPWLRERGDNADWEAWLSVERQELRCSLEVAAVVGGDLEHLGYPWWGSAGWAREGQVRLQLFYALDDRLAPPMESKAGYEARYRLHDGLTVEESDRLTAIMCETYEAACRRALLVDRGPQAVAS